MREARRMHSSKREIVGRPEKPVLALKPEEWKAVKVPKEMAKIFRALGDPVRAIIYDLLDQGPIRQVELTRLLRAAVDKKYDVAAVMHHLDIMKGAGLIGYEEFKGERTKVKMVYRTMDVLVQLHKRQKPDIATARPPKNIDELIAGLKKKPGE